MTNLANVLTRQGKLEEAERLQRRALESSQKVHGPENHETLSVMDKLGDILLKLDNYEQAEKVSREVLELRQRLLGKRGKFDAAEELHRQKVALCHTNMEKMTSMSDLARFLASRGRYDEAEHLLQEVVKLSTEALGRNSGKTQSAISQLGEVLIRNGKYKEAEAMHREVLVMGIA
jgi:tetratricopeptide (TPR) repeat protein